MSIILDRDVWVEAKMVKVVQGDKVQVICETRLEDGTRIDDEDDDPAMWIVAGKSKKSTPLAEVIVGMSKGEVKKVVLSPEKAFGKHDPTLVYPFDRNDLPSDLKVGDDLIIENEEGEMAVTVRMLDDSIAYLDANHPLAGKPLHITVKILAIKN